LVASGIFYSDGKLTNVLGLAINLTMFLLLMHEMGSLVVPVSPDCHKDPTLYSKTIIEPGMQPLVLAIVFLLLICVVLCSL
jgi:hypothetical protein